VLSIFYDGTCPLCTKEMDALRAYDQGAALVLVDIHSAAFADYPNIDLTEAMTILHAIDNDGVVLLGLDANAAAWRTVGKKPWVQCLRWPVIRWFADYAYLWFARNRYRLSWLLTGQSRCGSGQCAVEPKQKGKV